MITLTELFRLIGGGQSVFAVLLIFFLYYTFKNSNDSIKEYKEDADESTQFLKDELKAERERSDARESRHIAQLEAISRTLERIDSNQEKIAEGQKRTAKELERLQNDVDKVKEYISRKE